MNFISVPYLLGTPKNLFFFQRCHANISALISTNKFSGNNFRKAVLDARRRSPPDDMPSSVRRKDMASSSGHCRSAPQPTLSGHFVTPEGRERKTLWARRFKLSKPNMKYYLVEWLLQFTKAFRRKMGPTIFRGYRNGAMHRGYLKNLESLIFFLFKTKIPDNSSGKLTVVQVFTSIETGSNPLGFSRIASNGEPNPQAPILSL